MTWFTRLTQLADTRYYKEVLKACGTFRAWVSGQGGKRWDGGQPAVRSRASTRDVVIGGVASPRVA